MTALAPTITDGSVTLSFGAAGQYYGYCTIADVNYEFPDKDSYTTLTNSAIGQAITYTSSVELQPALERLYQMPYTGTDATFLLILREINAKLATADLIDRYFQGAEPDLSVAATRLRQFAELLVVDIQNGKMRFDPPFGDAVVMGELPTYPLSSGATVLPSPNSSDPFAATPRFTMGRTRFNRDGVM